MDSKEQHAPSTEHNAPENDPRPATQDSVDKPRAEPQISVADVGPRSHPNASGSAGVNSNAIDAGKTFRKGHNNNRRDKKHAPRNNRKKTQSQGLRRGPHGPNRGNQIPPQSTADISAHFDNDVQWNKANSSGNGIQGAVDVESNVTIVDATEEMDPSRLAFYQDDTDSPPGLSSDVLDAVVKIYATHCDPNYSLPWQMRRQTQSTSSGFVISNNRILTNAHSVEHYTVVKVKKRGSDHKFIARVLAIGNECDIALMTVMDEDFWTDLKPLKFGPLPELQASVIVMGFPIGGENISVTAGVVSRVEIQEYTHGASQLLGIQIDAAINSGSSGGPALNHKNEVVGIAFQSLNTGDSDNIGYLVAESVVDHFLKDFERNGRYTGFCYCGFQWQRMENISLRRSMKMKDDENGILVRRVDKTSEAPKVLREGDIITHIDGVAVSNAGTVPYRSGERISFHYIITTKFTGDKVRLRIIRDGDKRDVEYSLGEITRSHLVPVHDQRRQPEYLTVAGLVFVAISEPYLSAEYGDKWDLKAPVKLLEKWMHGYKETPDEQVVVLSQVLNAEINIGYEYVTNTTVHRFNGSKVRNLAHLAELVEKCEDEYLRFDLDHDEVVVVSRKEALECSAEILETHCIPAPYSIGPLPSSSSQKDKSVRGNYRRGHKKHTGPRAMNTGDTRPPRANGMPKRHQNKRNSKKPNKKHLEKKETAENGDVAAGAPSENKAVEPAGSTEVNPSSVPNDTSPVVEAKAVEVQRGPSDSTEK